MPARARHAKAHLVKNDALIRVEVTSGKSALHVTRDIILCVHVIDQTLQARRVLRAQCATARRVDVPKRTMHFARWSSVNSDQNRVCSKRRQKRRESCGTDSGVRCVTSDKRNRGRRIAGEETAQMRGRRDNVNRSNGQTRTLRSESVTTRSRTQSKDRGGRHKEGQKCRALRNERVKR